jgi:uncharacterized protein
MSMLSRSGFLIIPAVFAVMAGASSQGQGVEVTREDVNATTIKINMASKFFEATWRDIFARAGLKYPAPRMVGYVDATKSGCGELKASSAHYCVADNTIYYDIGLLTKMMKYAGHQLHTDGDYAPMVVLAHEMGHAVSHILDLNPSYANNRENLADCLAGVMTGYAAAAKNLEPGDFEEGELALKLGGDGPNTPFNSDHAHGTAEERVLMFERGFRGGLPACSESMANKLGQLRTSNTNGRPAQ